MAHLRAAYYQQQQQQAQVPPQQSSRTKELEEEVRRLTMENVKIKADLEKAQRRWERLKEGARRRRRDDQDSINGVKNEGSVPETVE
jgi:predicted RNase H-like nuclease (RuvC/YqgF family)